jgi:hypothetical protein
MIPEQILPVTMLVPAADAGGRASSYFSLKGAGRAFVVVYMNQAAANTVALSINQALTVAGGSPKAIGVTRIWTNIDAAAGAAYAKATEAATFTTAAGVAHKIVVFEVGPYCMDVAGGFDCVNVVTGASAAANITSAMLFITRPKYPGATAPISPIAD